MGVESFVTTRPSRKSSVVSNWLDEITLRKVIDIGNPIRDSPIILHLV